jgi:AcrR family transcriptional regulator
MDRPAGLRERKKEATRWALHTAAFELVCDRGLDNVTIEAIADAATVSRRTFSNYFASKEEALLYGESLRLRRLLDLVRARPAGEPAWAALMGATEGFAASGDQHSPWGALAHLVRGHPTVVYQQVVLYATAERDLAAELTGRLPDDPATPLRARVLAATFLTTLRVATRVAFEHPGSAQAELLQQALDMVQERFASPTG